MGNIGKEMADCFDVIIGKHPLSLEFETDARDIWPKRWEEIKNMLNKPITEHPDVQRLIKQAVLDGFKIKKLQTENEELEKKRERGMAAIDKHRCELMAENEKLKALLQRCKKTFEPFPIVSDLKSMTQMLREKHPETEVKTIKKMFKDREKKFRKLYRDMDQALKG